MNELQRCAWVGSDPLMIRYHDEEWGVPLHDDAKLFEFQVLDAFQAGLSWPCILHKRENLRRAFADFDPLRIALFDQAKVAELLLDAGITAPHHFITPSLHHPRTPTLHLSRTPSPLPPRTQLSNFPP